MPELFLKPAQFIRLDLFPAFILKVTDDNLENLTKEDARVIVTNNMFYVLLEDQPGTAKILVEGYLEEFSGSNKEGYSVTTADQSNFFITRSDGCGCGNTLRGFFPYPGVPRHKN